MTSYPFARARLIARRCLLLVPPHMPGFVPSPPARVSDRGPEAVQIWTDRWLDNNGDNLSEFDLDQIAESAEM